MTINDLYRQLKALRKEGMGSMQISVLDADSCRTFYVDDSHVADSAFQIRLSAKCGGCGRPYER